MAQYPLASELDGSAPGVRVCGGSLGPDGGGETTPACSPVIWAKAKPFTHPFSPEQEQASTSQTGDPAPALALAPA